MSAGDARPTIAFVLSMVGGLLILVVALLVALFGAVATFMMFGLGGIFGLWGVLCGIVIMYGGSMMNSHPEQHSTWGSIVLIFAILSWGSLGGFGVGFLLALIGGILGIVWSPPAPAGSRYCPSCGRPVDANARFCPSCGRQL